MPRIICYYEGQFFEFSTVVEGAVTGLMNEQEFIEFSTRMYGEIYAEDPGPEGLKARMDRAKDRGSSSMLEGGYDSLEEFLEMNTLNQYGPIEDGDSTNWPGLEKFMADSFVQETDESVDGSPDVIMPGDR